MYCKSYANTNIRFRTNNVNVYKDPKIRGSKIKILSLRKGDKLKSYTTIVDQNFFDKVKSCIEVDSSYLKNNLEIAKKYNLKIGDYFDEVYNTKLQIGDILFSNQTNEELSFEVVYKLDNKTVSGFECNWDTVQLCGSLMPAGLPKMERFHILIFLMLNWKRSKLWEITSITLF